MTSTLVKKRNDSITHLSNHSSVQVIRCIFYHHSHFLFLAYVELNFKFQLPSFRDVSVDLI